MPRFGESPVSTTASRRFRYRAIAGQEPLQVHSSIRFRPRISTDIEPALEIRRRDKLGRLQIERCQSFARPEGLGAFVRFLARNLTRPTVADLAVLIACASCCKTCEELAGDTPRRGFHGAFALCTNETKLVRRSWTCLRLSSANISLQRSVALSRPAGRSRAVQAQPELLFS